MQYLENHYIKLFITNPFTYSILTNFFQYGSMDFNPNSGIPYAKFGKAS